MQSWPRLRSWNRRRISKSSSFSSSSSNVLTADYEDENDDEDEWQNQIPRSASVLLMLLTIWTSRGWDFSNPSTEERRVFSESSSVSGF